MDLKAYLKIAAGIFMLILAGLGVILPILPTTPFLLAAVALFAAAPELREKVMRVPIFSAYIRNYREGSGLTKKQVVTSLISLWAAMGLSVYLTRSWPIALLLALIGSAVTAHILKIAKPRV